MNATKEEYKKYVQKMSPNSPILKNMFFAFIIGGAICVVGEALLEFYKSRGLGEEFVSPLVSITMIFLGAFFTGLGVYDKLAKFAGAGSIVPITGFANAIVAPAMEFKSEGLVLGLAAKMFVIAGPVLVYGIVSSIVFGFIYFLFTL